MELHHDRNEIQRLFDKLGEECHRRDVAYVEMLIEGPREGEGPWSIIASLDPLAPAKSHVIRWHPDKLGFDLYGPKEGREPDAKPDRNALSEYAVITWLWPS